MQLAAVKLLRPGLATDEFVERFRREGQALANLEHPNIARFLEAGVSTHGVPWLAMEHVDGEPLDTWADARDVGVPERLELFRQICSAVHYAHQNLVVHRDIKPSNVLVTTDGVVKLLDFGIAKILREPGEPGTHATTGTTGRFFSPEYASPEQVRGKVVATTSDVYSLGVVLFQLLTGRLPYDVTTDSPFELERMICERDAPRPSAVVKETPKLRRRLTGDLDTIVERCLRKEADRRYGSAEQLSEDVRRHLVGLPVLARRSTLAYRAWKFVRRNKLAVGAGLLVVMASVVSVVLAVRAERAADRARTTAAYLARLLPIADPNTRAAMTSREVAEAVGEIAALLDETYQDLPENLQQDVLESVSGFYASVDFQGRGRTALTRLVELLESRISPDDARLGRALRNLATIHRDLGDRSEAERLLQRALTTFRRALGNHEETAKIIRTLADFAARGRQFEKAERLHEEAIAMVLACDPPSWQAAISIQISHCKVIMWDLRDEPRARPKVARLVELVGRVAARSVEESHGWYAELAYLLQDLGDFDMAYKLALRALVFLEQRYAPDHPRIGRYLHHLGMLRKDQGYYEDAERIVGRSVRILRDFYGEQHADSILADVAMAKTLADAGRWAAAETWASLAVAYYEARDADVARMTQAVARGQLAYESSRAPTGVVLTLLGRVRHHLGRHAEALVLLKRSERLQIEILPPTSWELAKTRTLIGACLTELGQLDEARPYLVNAHPILERSRRLHHRRTIESLERVVRHFEVAQDADELAKWTRKLDAANAARAERERRRTRSREESRSPR
ncbi:MAG: hypothetical protein CL908_06260 [Deltaproteobacteria bacterium]|nr:hypothetical protein [Deltaproteobacteria bacterium]